MQANNAPNKIAFTQETEALAKIISLTKAGVAFSVARQGSGGIEVIIADASSVLIDGPLPAYLVLQEGESKEFFASLHNDRTRAEKHQESCRKAYRASEVIEVPPVLALLAPQMADIAEAITRSAIESFC